MTDDKFEERVYRRVKFEGYRSIERIACSYGERYRVLMADGKLLVMKVPDNDTPSKFADITKRQCGGRVEIEPGVYRDPFAPQELRVLCRDIGEGHVCLDLRAPDGTDYVLRLPIEDVRAIARETAGLDLE